MENLKIRVNNEDENKEDQGIFKILGGAWSEHVEAPLGSRRPRPQRRNSRTHRHRPPLQERHRAAGEAVRNVHEDND